MCCDLDKNRKGKQLFLFHLLLPMFTGLLESVFHIYCIFPTALIVTVFFTTVNFLHPEFCPLLLFRAFLYSFLFFFLNFSLFSPSQYILFPDYSDTLFLFLNGYSLLPSLEFINSFTLQYKILLCITQWISVKGAWIFFLSLFLQYLIHSFLFSPFCFSSYSCSSEEIFPDPLFLDKILRVNCISSCSFPDCLAL